MGTKTDILAAIGQNLPIQPTMYYTVFPSGALWYWNLKAANHEIIAQSEGYTTKANALHAVSLVKASHSAPVVGA